MVGAYTMGIGFVDAPLVMVFAGVGLAVPLHFLVHESLFIERLRRRHKRRLWNKAEAVSDPSDVDDP